MLDRDELIAPAAKSESSTATADPVRARTSAAPVAVVTVSPVLSVAVAKFATAVSLRLSNRVSTRLQRVVSRLPMVPQPAPAPVVSLQSVLTILGVASLRKRRGKATAASYRISV